MRWTVNRQIWTGFGVVLTLLALTALLAWLAMGSTGRDYGEAVAQQQDGLRAEEGLAEFDAANLAFLRYLLVPDDVYLNERRAGLDSARHALDALLVGAVDSARADALLEAWEQGSQASIAAMRAGGLRDAIRIRDERALQPARALQALIRARARTEQAAAARAVNEARRTERFSRSLLLVGAPLALLAGIATALLLSRAINRQLRDATGTLASTASEILAATTQQASGASQTTAAVAETAATVDEVAQTAEQAAERARRVAETAQRAADIGRQGRAAVEQTMGAMNRVDAQVGSIATSILALAEQAQSIGEIISSVDEIAGQTNLLALNAAIEASRAGEFGRGFAVVAGEIRSLAEQSKKATVQVRQILGDIQRATSAAVMSTEEGTKQVAAGTRQVTEAGETIRTLAETAAEAAQAAVQIAASSNQQSAGMAQIRQAMTQIQQASTQNLSAVRQTERAAQDLSRLGADLLALVGAGGRDGVRRG
jgi:methyl-accepting chemotaxis protein